MTALVKAGVITPGLNGSGAYLLDFQEIVLLRSAAALAASKVPPARLARFLTALRSRLPPDAPLSSVRISMLGNELVVKLGDALENVAGQMLLDFAGAAQGALHAVPAISPAAASPEGRSAGRVAVKDRLAQLQALEHRDKAAAIEAYRQLLAEEPDCVDAALNLCALLLETDDAQGAFRVARDALKLHPTHALLHYNFAVACEECDRLGEALTAYSTALALDTTLADAHFNAAQLHESLGHPRDALRHMAAYRRLQRS